VREGGREREGEREGVMEVCEAAEAAS
jgi:hypothetical protein